MVIPNEKETQKKKCAYCDNFANGIYLIYTRETRIIREMCVSHSEQDICTICLEQIISDKLLTEKKYDVYFDYILARKNEDVVYPYVETDSVKASIKKRKALLGINLFVPYGDSISERIRPHLFFTKHNGIYIDFEHTTKDIRRYPKVFCSINDTKGKYMEAFTESQFHK